MQQISTAPAVAQCTPGGRSVALTTNPCERTEKRRKHVRECFESADSESEVRRGAPGGKGDERGETHERWRQRRRGRGREGRQAGGEQDSRRAGRGYERQPNWKGNLRVLSRSRCRSSRRRLATCTGYRRKRRRHSLRRAAHPVETQGKAVRGSDDTRNGSEDTRKGGEDTKGKAVKTPGKAVKTQ